MQRYEMLRFRDLQPNQWKHATNCCLTISKIAQIHIESNSQGLVV